MKMVYATLAAALVGAPALAADFSGPRIEANVGWDRPQLHVDLNNFSAHGHDSGVVYGGEAGYDLRFGNLVVGAMAGIDATSAKDCEQFTTSQSCFKAGRDWAVGARVGAVIAPRMMIYGKGEYVNVRLKGAFNDAVDTVDNFSGHDDRGGYRLAAGAEFDLARNLYVKAEYRYTNYKDYRYDIGDADVGRADLSRHQIVGGVGLRF